MDKEFVLDNHPNYKFRVAKIPATEIIAIARQLDLEDYKKLVTLTDYALEHIEVIDGEKWQPVKIAGRQVYNPFGIENDLILLNDLVNYFLDEVVFKNFIKSNG